MCIFCHDNNPGKVFGLTGDKKYVVGGVAMIIVEVESRACQAYIYLS